jgi:hypothetical protein
MMARPQNFIGDPLPICQPYLSNLEMSLPVGHVLMF